jgi:predicted 3-demethylubiquinone-9 3-methyltransferase (glyoxalase superfamily)
MAIRRKTSKSKSKRNPVAKARPARKTAKPGSRVAAPARKKTAPRSAGKAAGKVDDRGKIFPFLWYARDADAAARFYASIFPDSRVDRVTAMQSDSPSGPPGSVKVVDFTLFGQRFQAMTAGPHHDFNDAVSIVVLCENQQELDRYWSALLEGGQPQACGWLTDRWGVRWQIVPRIMDKLMADPDRERSKRVTDAMLKMIKFDIATLERAARGGSRSGRPEDR